MAQPAAADALLRRRTARVDGVLLLDKPVGLSSNAALVQARGLLDAAKAGHTGTLDPLASGLLLICCGEATKFAGLMLEADKTYEAVVALGVTTTTGDAEGEVVSRSEVVRVDPGVRSVLEQFKGLQWQTPPMYSALKHRGRPLYRYARAGEHIERTQRQITVHELELLAVRNNELHLRVRTSKGTYVRTLAEAIGERLGCGAHLRGLRRTAIGALGVGQAIALDQLAALSPEQRRQRLRPPDMLVGCLPRLELSTPWDRAIQKGQRVPAPASLQHGPVRLYDRSGRFLGVGEVRVPGEVVPRRLLAGRPGDAPRPGA